MAQNLPYLPSYKNVGKLFEKIATAKTPDAFTNQFLYETLGLKSAGDRPLINLLKTLGFVDGSGKPTQSYSLLKNPSAAKLAIAQAVRKAYEPLFAANEKAYEVTGTDLKGLISQVAGTDENLTSKIAGTFSTLAKLGNFVGVQPEKEEPDEKKRKDEDKSSGAGQLRSEFHYNIQIHLPSNASEETYLSIFSAFRKVFK
ncbi:MAG TPA: DUF5343 domain-containing protein [Verrucomicrobiae bacterium]|nr:DUF5343 domain-containing protein [Verrucomicrobiae bacterium]